MTISTLQTSTTEALLERIAMALERLTPPLTSPLVGEAKAYQQREIEDAIHLAENWATRQR